MILITGCAGFIGYHLSEALIKKNYKVIGIDCIDDYYSKKLKINRLENLRKNKNFIFFKHDLNDYQKTKKLLKKYKVSNIIHLAAQPGVRISVKEPLNTLKQNLLPFINILEIARLKKVKKFIYASSSSIYGDSKIFPFSENDFKNKPISVYGASKLSNEIIAEAFSKNFKLKCVGLRFFTVYGPYGRPDMAYFSFLNNLKKKKFIDVYNKGKMMRDFTYIEDIVVGIIKTLTAKIKTNNEILNIGKGKPDELMDLVNELEKNIGKKFKINFTNNIPLGDIKKTFSNTYKARKLINWKPKTDLKKGVKKFVDWYKFYYGIK